MGSLARRPPEWTNGRQRGGCTLCSRSWARALKASRYGSFMEASAARMRPNETLTPSKEPPFYGGYQDLTRSDLASRGFCKQEVTGSIPVGSTILLKVEPPRSPARGPGRRRTRRNRSGVGSFSRPSWAEMVDAYRQNLVRRHGIVHRRSSTSATASRQGRACSIGSTCLWTRCLADAAPLVSVRRARKATGPPRGGPVHSSPAIPVFPTMGASPPAATLLVEGKAPGRHTGQVRKLHGYRQAMPVAACPGASSRRARDLETRSRVAAAVGSEAPVPNGR